jgi:predicted DNA-binding transcriptional regulator AlpA
VIVLRPTGGHASRQETNTSAAAEGSGPAVRHHVPLMLLDRHQAAAVFGISSRTFEELKDAEWMPRPVQLGPRLLRWPLSELQCAIARMPRQLTKGEPVRERIDRLKRGGAQ